MLDRLLIAGGANDPNICYLVEEALDKGISVLPFLIADDSSPSFFWDITKDEFLIRGEAIHVSAAFIRRDVFHQPGVAGHDRALTWYTALIGWIAVHPQVRVLNRASISTYTNKLWVLELAAKAGLLIPDTFVTNNAASIGAFSKDLVAKPVMGGGYCQSLDSLLDDTEFRMGLAANPAIVQQWIKGDDVRIYRVDQHYFGFFIISEGIDYRQSPEYELKVIKRIPKNIKMCLSNLMDKMGLNWGAVDFKRCHQTEKWYFLEVNSNPMFSVFDRKAAGKISDKIFQSLLKQRH